MKHSYSRLGCFANCPYRYRLQYIDKLKTIPDTDPGNALYLGLAIHKGVEEGSVEAGIKEYLSHYNILTDDMVNWIIQLEYQLPKLIDLLPKGGEHELEINTDTYRGYIDYICGDTLYDFKFSNNVDYYLESPQLSIYKAYLEMVRPDIKINHLKYVFIPKIQIRQKFKATPPETLYEFRTRLQEHLEASEIRVIEVDYDMQSVTQFMRSCQLLETIKKFPKNPTKLCKWCNYQKYCESNGKEDWMIL